MAHSLCIVRLIRRMRPTDLGSRVLEFKTKALPGTELSTSQLIFGAKLPGTREIRLPYQYVTDHVWTEPWKNALVSTTTFIEDMGNLLDPCYLSGCWVRIKQVTSLDVEIYIMNHFMHDSPSKHITPQTHGLLSRRPPPPLAMDLLANVISFSYCRDREFSSPRSNLLSSSFYVAKQRISFSKISDQSF
ncbi:hypothetical protein VNO77_03927 [Canavalia gladiata]|uniref:Uncharacterized protein n=1 Tax=Canavalia gladiata TaxID=3824 RepID=A0AAN9MW89_CANGL